MVRSSFPNPAMSGLDWSRGILVRGDISGPELIQFVRRRLGKNALEGCRPVRAHMFELSFREQVLADRFAALGSPFDVEGKLLEQRRAGLIVKTIFVHGLPFPFPDAVLSHYLSQYGEVQGVEREKWKDLDEETGVRLAKLVVKTDPPNFLRMGDFTARLSYAGLVRVCKKCGGTGHLAESCSIQRCYNCSETGHLAAVCPQPCHLCQGDGHSFLSCSRKSFAQVLAGARASVQPPQSVAMPEESHDVTPVSASPGHDVSDAASSDRPCALEKVTPECGRKEDRLELSETVIVQPMPSVLTDSDVVPSDCSQSSHGPPEKKSCPADLSHSANCSDESSEDESMSAPVVINAREGKVPLDLVDVYSHESVQNIRDRAVKPKGARTVGYWRDTREKLFLLPWELSTLDQHLTSCRLR